MQIKTVGVNEITYASTASLQLHHYCLSETVIAVKMTFFSPSFLGIISAFDNLRETQMGATEIPWEQ